MIRSIGWEPGPPPLSGTLEVEFDSGAVYSYSGVPAEVAMDVILGVRNDSVGASFHYLVRRVDYPFVRVA